MNENLQHGKNHENSLNRRKGRKGLIIYRITVTVLLCIIFFILGRVFYLTIHNMAMFTSKQHYETDEKIIITDNSNNDATINGTAKDGNENQISRNKNIDDSKEQTFDNQNIEAKDTDMISEENTKEMNINNEIIVIDTSSIDWNLILVNPWNKLPEDFSVSRTQLINGHSIDERVYPDLQKMMDDCRAEGLSPIICSSFRTMEKQQSLFDRQINKYLNRGYSREESEIEAAKWVAVPGTSEHQSGLAVDIVALSYQLLDDKQENTPEQQWLMKNCYKYGFVLRFPKNKVNITGISYEPWHYRYVGKEAAKVIMEEGICLEEYLENI
ncbi:hypothetical protein SH1V18_21400 [Vallitalea longa]|uniref:D-alanyl-D-alanine carboxypeptidase-like core domain-containing protein n=1 Tax=Vallitalea longa TaxID=2936439 RepID=A0A9W5YBP9_9FIRM|nr:M15 family metallopeptidase [Vallitalea longa]GKX29660.1 hypothetical protein SH1V18_21400 [Vallitalea longa]